MGVCHFKARESNYWFCD